MRKLTLKAVPLELGNRKGPYGIYVGAGRYAPAAIISRHDNGLVTVAWLYYGGGQAAIAPSVAASLWPEWARASIEAISAALAQGTTATTRSEAVAAIATGVKSRG